jgi:spore coat protein U-like protein
MRMMTGLGVLAGLACIGGPAVATTSVTNNIAVSLTIASTCVIRSTSTMPFGSLGVLGGISGTDPNYATATIAVQCTDTTAFDIGLDGGAHGGSALGFRKLLNTAALSTATVNYELFTDSGYSTNWGNLVGTDTSSKIGDGASHTYTVYGRIPAQTTPVPGTYTDVVTVTVTY